MGFNFFNAPKPRTFNYTPRYYDPAKEALEKKKAAMGLDSKLSEEEKRRMRIRRGFGYAPEEMEEKGSLVSKEYAMSCLSARLFFWCILSSERL